MAKSSGGQAQVLLEIHQIRAADVSQLHVLEVRPDAFVRVQVGCIARQLFESQAFGRTLGQKGLDRSAAMNRRAVPDHEQLAGNASQQVLEEVDDLRTAERVILHAQEQSATRGDATDDGQVVTRKRGAQRGWVAAWGQAADQRGQ